MQKTLLALLAVTAVMFATVVGLARHAFVATFTAQIIAPANHSTVSGTIESQGTAAAPDFHYSKV